MASAYIGLAGSLPAAAVFNASSREIRAWPWPSRSSPTTTGLRQTRTTARCEGQAALGTRIRSLNFQPVASDGLALAASTKRARGWQLGLVRTTANLYGSTAWPDRKSTRLNSSH